VNTRGLDKDFKYKEFIYQKNMKKNMRKKENISGN